MFVFWAFLGIHIRKFLFWWYSLLFFKQSVVCSGLEDIQDFPVCRQHHSVFLILIWNQNHLRWATLYLWARTIDFCIWAVELKGWYFAFCLESYRQTHIWLVRHSSLIFSQSLQWKRGRIFSLISWVTAF